MVIGEDWSTPMLSEWRMQWALANFNQARYPSMGIGGHCALENRNIQQLGVESHATDIHVGDEYPLGAEALNINNNHIDSDINKLLFGSELMENGSGGYAALDT